MNMSFVSVSKRFILDISFFSFLVPNIAWKCVHKTNEQHLSGSASRGYICPDVHCMTAILFESSIDIIPNSTNYTNSLTISFISYIILLLGWTPV